MSESLSEPKQLDFDGNKLTYWVAKRLINVGSVGGMILLQPGDHLVLDQKMTVMVMDPKSFRRFFQPSLKKQRGK